MSQIDPKAIQLIALAESAAIGMIAAEETVEVARRALADAEAKSASMRAPFDDAIESIVRHKGDITREQVESMIMTRLLLVGGASLADGGPTSVSAPPPAAQKPVPAAKPSAAPEPEAPKQEPQVPAAPVVEPPAPNAPAPAEPQQEVVVTPPVAAPVADPIPDDGSLPAFLTAEEPEVEVWSEEGADAGSSDDGDVSEVEPPAVVVEEPKPAPTAKPAATRSPASRSNRPAPVAKPEPPKAAEVLAPAVEPLVPPASPAPAPTPAAAPAPTPAVETLEDDDLPEFLTRT